MLTVDLVAEVVGAAPAVGEAVLGVVADVGGGDQEAASGHSAQSLVRVRGLAFFARIKRAIKIKVEKMHKWQNLGK